MKILERIFRPTPLPVWLIQRRHVVPCNREDFSRLRNTTRVEWRDAGRVRACSAEEAIAAAAPMIGDRGNFRVMGFSVFGSLVESWTVEGN